MKISLTHWLAPVLLAACGTIQAQGFYVGGNVGVVWVNDDAFDSTAIGGLRLGYEFDVATVLRLGIEAEVAHSLADGDFEVFGFDGDWDIETRALYGVLRIGEEFYGKARIGVLDEEVSAHAGGISDKASDSGFSYGFGIGWRARQNIALEADVTQIEQDVGSFTVGMIYHF
jgi:hypothetical protein